MKDMSKCISLVLALAIAFSAFAMPASAAKEYGYVETNVGNYTKYDHDRNLTDDAYYSYDDFADQMDDSISGNVMMFMGDVLTDLEYYPDVEDYMDVLTDIMVLKDAQDASNPQTQMGVDEMKTPESYLEDLGEIGLGVIDVYTGDLRGDMEQKIGDMIGMVSDSTMTTAETVLAMQNMQRVVESYSEYDSTLALIENNATGELKEAAGYMRDHMELVMEYYLSQTTDDLLTGGFLYANSIFDYCSDDFFKWADDQKIEDGAKIVSNLKKMKDQYDLGADIAVLAGNAYLDAEDAAQRVRHIQVLDEITDVLVDVVDSKSEAYVLNYVYGFATEKDARAYEEVLRWLLATRRRGEYCLYSLIMDDSGMLSDWFATDDVRQWYLWVEEFLDDQQWWIERLLVDPEVLAIHYYVVFDGVASSWEEAAAYCESLGGHLATIGSKAENDHVHNIMIESGYKSAYFGMTDRGTEGTWRTVNGEPVTYFNWGGSEPNNEGGDENYAMFYHKFPSGGWNDGDFGGNTAQGGTAFICEWDIDPFVEGFDPKQVYAGNE